MSDPLRLSNVEFTATREADARRGLLGWVAFVLANTLLVESVAVRRTRSGRLVLSFPRRADRHGNARYDCRPVDDAARASIESLVIAALDLKQETGP